MRLDQNKFRVFISHKSADKELADKVAAVLRDLDPRDQVDPWVSGQDLVVGGDWNRAIKRRLAESHLLVLLYTQRSYEWDWCLYETGLFTQFDEDDVSGVVCIYNPHDQPPAPLANLQGVRAEPEALEQCLRQLFRATWQVSDDWRRGSLDPAGEQPADAKPDYSPTDRRIAGAAQVIAKEFARSLRPDAASGERPTGGDDVYYPCHRVVLDFGEPNGHTWDRIPEDAVVVEGFPNTSSYTLSLFGAAEGRRRRTWGELLEGLHGDTGWADELDQAFVQALDERLFPVGSATFKALDLRADARREYLPMLYRVLRSGPDRTPVGVTIVLHPIPD